MGKKKKPSPPFFSLPFRLLLRRVLLPGRLPVQALLLQPGLLQRDGGDDHAPADDGGGRPATPSNHGGGRPAAAPARHHRSGRPAAATPVHDGDGPAATASVNYGRPAAAPTS